MLIDFREREKEGEVKGEKHFICAPTGHWDQTHNLGMYSDCGLNAHSFNLCDTLQQLSHMGPGQSWKFWSHPTEKTGA